MNGKRIAIVVSHPAHLLTVCGMLLRWRPQVLILYRSVVGGGVGQEEALCSALAALGLADRIESFGVGETESFGRALAGDHAFHVELRDRLFAWLRAKRSEVVLGDAFEAYNFHHDVARLLIDDAVQRVRNFARRMENYEFPLSCRVDEPGSPIRYGAFPFGSFRTLRLSAAEFAVKRELIDRVGRVDPFVAETFPLFDRPEVETYRDVPPDRDYTAPPPGLALFYDEHGRKIVDAGRFAQPIAFRNHFVPLVRSLQLRSAA